jgi:hypothetical protein
MELANWTFNEAEQTLHALLDKGKIITREGGRRREEEAKRKQHTKKNVPTRKREREAPQKVPTNDAPH